MPLTGTTTLPGQNSRLPPPFRSMPLTGMNTRLLAPICDVCKSSTYFVITASVIYFLWRQQSLPGNQSEKPRGLGQSPSGITVAHYRKKNGNLTSFMPLPRKQIMSESEVLADRLLCRKLISKKEFFTFEEKMCLKYGLEKTSICRDSRCYVSVIKVTSHSNG